MSAVREREELMRMLLAEVAPDATWIMRWEKSAQGEWPAWRGSRFAEVNLKASYLLALEVFGPDKRVNCRLHMHGQCDFIPVSWALLGHTCGRA